MIDRIKQLHSVIRDIPKPVIAKVRGFAIGGGNVFCNEYRLALDCAALTVFRRQRDRQNIP